MPQGRFRSKGTRKTREKSRSSQGTPTALRATALVQGTSQIQISDGSFNVVGGDSHTHFHNHDGTTVSLESILRAIPNFRKIQQDTLAKATPGTGAWLLKCDKFRVWLEPNGDIKILWGSGIPGAGKTITAALVIDMLEALSRESGYQICVCFVYIRYSDRDQVTVRGILEILVNQTVERHPACQPIVAKAFARHVKERTRPTETELLVPLRQLVEETKATFYVLDALDEAPVGIRLDLVKKLSSLGVRLFITSRSLQVLEAKFPDAHTFTIAAQDQDLDLHISEKLDTMEGFQDLLECDPTLRDRIIETAKSKCGGMFLHASLQLDALQRCLTPHDVMQTLQGFPEKIEDVYRQTWDRIMNSEPHYTAVAQTAFVWVLNSKHLMTIDQLRHALATSPDTYNFESSRLISESALMALCRGLIAVDKESRFVRLALNIDYTVKRPLEELLAQSFPHPHCHLAIVCMTHLTNQGLQDTSIDSGQELNEALQADPLLDYAYDAWAFHARQSLDHEAISKPLSDFVTGCTAFPVPASVAGRLFDIVGPLHLIAIFDLPIAIAGPHSTHDPNPTTQKCGDTPLNLACLHGNDNAALTLLRCPNILVNQTNIHGASALMNAACGGYESIVKLLFDQPELDANLANCKGWSPLMEAVYRDREGTVRLLLDHPNIDINAVNHRGHSALMMAHPYGRGTIAKLLLNHPRIDINLADIYEGQSTLLKEMCFRYIPKVKLLFGRPDVEVNLLGSDGRSALTVAATSNHASTLKALLDHPNIEVNWVGRMHHPELLKALSQILEYSVRLLLARPGIDVNRVNSNGWSALMQAVSDCQEATTEILLAHTDIDVNVSIDGWSALMIAAWFGYHGIVKRLLAHPYIEVNASDAYGTTALLAASKSGHTKTVEQLLAAPDIDVNAVDRDGDTPIKSAAEEGHPDIVRMLLDASGVDIGITSKRDGHTALSAALAEGHEDVARLLRDFESARSRSMGQLSGGGLALPRDTRREDEAYGSDIDDEVFVDALEFL